MKISAVLVGGLVACFISLFVSVAINVSGAEAGEMMSRFKLDKWSGGAYADDRTKEFSYCVATTSYSTGTQLAFVLYRDRVLQLMLANDDWVLDDIPEYTIGISIDGRVLGEFTARPSQGDTLLIQFGQREDVFDALRYGNVLSVNPGPDALNFELSDTFEALTRVSDCVRAALIVRKPSNPFASKRR